MKQYINQDSSLKSRIPFSSVAAILIGLGCMASLAILVATRRWGIGVVADSTVYLGAARSFLTSGRLRDFDSFGQPVPLVHYPPLLPVILTGISWIFRIDPMSSARWLGAFLFGLNISLLGFFAWRLLKSAWIGLTIAFLGFVFTPMLDLHLMALSEPLYVLFSMSALFVIIRYLETPKFRLLLVASLLAALAFFTRYAGVALVGSGVVAILLFQRRTIGQAFRNAFIYAFVSALPTGIWLVRSHFLAAPESDNFLGRAYSHPIAVGEIIWGIHSISTWFLPGLLPLILQIIFVVAAVVLLVAAYYCGFADRKHINQLQALLNPEDEKLVRVALLFIIFHLAVVLGTMWFLDGTTRLDDRILLPLFPPLAILLLAGARRMSSIRLFGRPAYMLPALLLVLMILTNAPRSVGRMLSFAKYGRGYTAEDWHDSGLIKALASVSDDVPIYTTLPSSIRFLTGRDVRQLPNTYNPRTYQENSNYRREISRMQTEVSKSGIVLVYFSGDFSRWYPSELAITKELNLRLLAKDDKGSVYVSPSLVGERSVGGLGGKRLY